MDASPGCILHPSVALTLCFGDMIPVRIALPWSSDLPVSPPETILGEGRRVHSCDRVLVCVAAVSGVLFVLVGRLSGVKCRWTARWPNSSVQVPLCGT